MEQSSRPIGVFDSGIGGLTAVSELKRILPNEDIVYLGDTARVPYGTKSRETILRYASQDLEFLKRFDVKFTIAACGTVSSVMAGESLFGGLCTGVILPAVAKACSATKNKKIGVIATVASVRSGSYERLIKQRSPEVKVYSKACPMFVPLVENGYTYPGCEPTALIAREYLEPLRDEEIDTLILGCTHYPLLSEIISEVMGEGVTLISSGAEAADYAKKYLQENDLLKKEDAPGRLRFFCTDSPELFRENAARFIDIGGATVERCDL